MDPATGRDEGGDVYVVEGKIAEAMTGEYETIDASGKYVMPGFVDLHVHLREPGFEYKETIKTGTMAAAKGGFTGVCPMPNTKPSTDSPERIKKVLEIAKKDSPIHVYPVGAVTIGQAGETVTDIEGMVKAGAKAISEDGKSVMNSAVYEKAMKEAARLGIPVMAHCEDKNLVGKGAMNAGKAAERLGITGITNAVEDVIVARDILLAKETGAQLHLCHCSTADSVTMIQKAREDGVRVSGEVCPHHFSMTEDDILEDDANYKMNPPLRTAAEVERLITEPISREIQSMSGVYKIKSESMYGLSKITFELQPSLSASSIPQKWDELRRKVLNIQPQLPSGASTTTVSDDFGDVFGIYYGLTADDGFSYDEMRNWAERIKTQVVTADGVMKVALFGVQTEVVNIFISTNKLVGMGIDPKQLASLLQSQNQIINTGEIRAGEQQLRVTANGMYTTIDDIRNQVITTKAGQVKLGDIAVIE